MLKNIKRGIRKSPFLSLAADTLYHRARQLGSRGRWRKLSQSKKIMLELGSGARKGKNGWTTIDMVGADINYDLCRGIPLEDETVDAIYTSHLFEHIPYQQLLQLISECRRVLKHGGGLSVCVPNAGHYISAYIQKKAFLEQPAMYQPAVVNTGSLLDQVNYIAYMGGEHAYMFDEQNLINTIKKAGFEHVGLREFNKDMDSKTRDFESIYALAIKQ